MSKKYAIIKGEIVDCIAIADSPLPVGGEWIDLTDVDPKPTGPGWRYIDGKFIEPEVPEEAKVVEEVDANNDVESANT